LPIKVNWAAGFWLAALLIDLYVYCMGLAETKMTDHGDCFLALFVQVTGIWMVSGY
jgi:hypothetical protein